MKKITLFMGLVLVTTVSFSQVIVKLTSVPCNTALEGTYPYGESGWPAQPDLLDGNNAISGSLELINDGTPGDADTYLHTPPNGAPYPSPPLNPAVPASACGCDTTGNLSQNMAGKIALIYRGACNFSLKAYNAQKRGAVGVIIINHTGDPIPMGAGALGGSVTIPVVMVGRVAGDDLFLAMNSCAPGTVTGFIGSKVGIFADDMGSSIADIVMPNELARPLDMAAGHNIDLGMWAFNYGTNAQSGVTASVDIQFNGGGSVYSNTSTALNFAAPAGSPAVVDTQYFDLGNYAPGAWGVGTYTVTYSFNMSTTDLDPSDNVFVYNFEITNSGDIYAKSRLDPVTKVPLTSTAYSLNETSTLYDDWEACIVFKEATPGMAMGMTFTGEPVGTDIDFEVVEVRAYEWNDAFVDLNTTPTYAAIVPIPGGAGSATYFWDHASNGNLEGEMVYQPFDIPFTTIANKRYLFCIYNASDSVRIGYDTRIDYAATVNNYLQPVSPVKVLPNGQAVDWNWGGFGYDATPSISVTFDIATSVLTNESSNIESAPYPNPATNLLRVPVRKGVKGDVTVEIYDLAGKLVISEKQTIGNEALRVNVASIANGAYVFNLTFADGSTDTFKVSVNR